MKAIGFDQPFNLDEGNQFKTYDIDLPQPNSTEILVKVKSISVNPVDTKQRQLTVSHPPRILGFDAVGTVEAIGNNMSMFEVGDRVFYSGSPSQHGSNAEYQVIDEQLVAHAPENITNEQAASLPLTGLTASETLFDCFNISDNPKDNKGKTILIINGAGGVGSIATQIASHYGLQVITTASRDETEKWCYDMGQTSLSIIKRFKTTIKSTKY